MKIITGDIFDLVAQGNFDILIHGCNCFCVMGKGFARDIKHYYPEAYAADCRTSAGDHSKLGSYTKVTTTRHGKGGDIKFNLPPLTIVNAYSQFDYGPSGRRADYKAIHSVFKKIKEEFSGKQIVYPRIGAGLARGNWTVISEIINEELAGESHTLVLLPE